MEDKNKVRIPIITRKEIEITFFRGSGKGGQKKNKTSSACRCHHPPSGAIGISQDTRSQLQNRRLAFTRMAKSPKFQKWLKIELSRIHHNENNIDKKVEENMREENMRVEYWNSELKKYIVVK